MTATGGVGARPVEAGGSAPVSRLRPGTRAHPAGERVRDAGRDRGADRLLLVLVVAAGLAGAVVVALAAGPGQVLPAWVGWGGLGLATLPALVVALARSAGALARRGAVATAALVTAVPVGVATADGPRGIGPLLQYAHLMAVARGGPLLDARLPAAIGQQPGLAAVTALVGRLADWSVWHDAALVLLAAHVVAVLAVRSLARVLGAGERVACAAAVLWSAGAGVPGTLSPVSGAGLALAAAVWALVAVARAGQPGAAARRRAWVAVAVLLAGTTALTDLVVASVLLVGAALVAVAVVLAPAVDGGWAVAGESHRRIGWPAPVGVAVVTGAWWLTPAGRAVWGDGDGLTAAGRGLLPGGVVQVVAGAVAWVVAAVLVGFVLRGGERGRRPGGPAGPVGAVALVLLAAAVPLLATGLGAVAIAAWWPLVSAAAVTPVVVGLAPLVDVRARRVRPADGRTGVTGRPRVSPGTVGVDRRTWAPTGQIVGRVALGVSAALVVLLGPAIATTAPAGGAASTGTTAGPGPSADLLVVGARLLAVAGPGFRFAASDATTAAVLARTTGGSAVTGLDADVVFAADPAGATLLRAAEVGWLVDTRSDPAADLGRAPWLVRALTAPGIAVYRVRPAAVGLSDPGDPAAVVPAAAP